jgi:hypothetical protein
MGIDILAVLPVRLLSKHLLRDIFGEEAIYGKGPILVLFGTGSHRLEGTDHFARKFVRDRVGPPRVNVLSVWVLIGPLSPWLGKFQVVRAALAPNKASEKGFWWRPILNFPAIMAVIPCLLILHFILNYSHFTYDIGQWILGGSLPEIAYESLGHLWKTGVCLYISLHFQNIYSKLVTLYLFEI